MAWYPPQKRMYKVPFDPYNPIDPLKAYRISLMSMNDVPGLDKSMRKQWSDNIPFFPEYEEDVSVVSKDVSPFHPSWIRGDDVVDEPGYDYGLKNPNPGPYLGSSPYINTTRSATTSSSPTPNTPFPGSEKVYPNTPPPGFGSSYKQIPSGVDPGLVSANARVASGASGAGGGKWKKVLEHLGKMTGPEPDWSLSPQKMGVPSPWSPTNVAWSPVGADMFGRKKKKGPY